MANRNNLLFRKLKMALGIAALAASQQAAADVIELNNFWAGHGSAVIDFTGIDWHTGATVTGLHEHGGSGGFKTYNLTTDPARQDSFQSWCVDIFHNFSFSVQSQDTLKPANIALAGSSATLPTSFSQKAADDLARLYTNHHSAVDSKSSTGANESAFQLAVWEIVNERSGTYSLGNGNFRATGTGSSTAAIWLSELATPSASKYSANIWTVQMTLSTGKGYAQDVVVFSPVPEPETYAMLLAGLGLLSFTAKRRKQSA